MSVFMSLFSLGLFCSNCVGASSFSSFTEERRGESVNITISEKHKFASIETDALKGVTLTYVRDDPFESFEVRISLIKGTLRLVEGTPSPFGIRIESKKKNFRYPLFVSVPIKGLTNSVTAIGFNVNKDGSLSVLSTIKVDRQHGSATFAVLGPALIVWGVISLED